MTDRRSSRILSVRRLLCVALALGWSGRSLADAMPVAAEPSVPVGTTAGSGGMKAAGVSPTQPPPTQTVAQPGVLPVAKPATQAGAQPVTQPVTQPATQLATQPGTTPAPPAAAIDGTPPEIAGDRADAIAHDVVLHPPQKQIAPQDAAHLRTTKLKLGGLLDRSVHGTENTEVGRVIDVMVGEDGKPEAIELDVGGFMGVGNRKIAVAWGLFDLSKPGTDPLRVLLTEAQVKSAPEVEVPGDMTVVTGVDATVPVAAAVAPVPARPPASSPTPLAVPAISGSTDDRSGAPVDPPIRPGVPDPAAAVPSSRQAAPAPVEATVVPDLKPARRHGDTRRPAVTRPEPARMPPILATMPTRPSVDAPVQPSGDGPPRPSVGKPPEPSVGRPPEPSVDEPAQPAVDGPPKPSVDGPPKPSVDGPPKPSPDGRP